MQGARTPNVILVSSERWQFSLIPDCRQRWDDGLCLLRPPAVMDGSIYVVLCSVCVV